MPVASPMKSMRFCRLVSRKSNTSGSRDAGFNNGGAVSRPACARIASMGGGGRDASIRARMA